MTDWQQQNDDYPDPCLEAERREDAAEFAREQQQDDAVLRWYQEQDIEQAYNSHKDTYMKLNDMIESKFLKQSDVQGDVLVTVESLKKVNVAREDEDPSYKWTVKFHEFPKPMALNVTNLKRMAKFLGDDSDDWVNGKVTVYVDPDIEFGGDIVGGLRIKAGPRPQASAKPRMTESEANAALDDDIPF